MPITVPETLPQKPVNETIPTTGVSEEEEDESKSKGGKSRRELPAGAVATLKAWLLSPEHFTHPYPTPQDQVLLMQKTGIDKKQLKNWFTNARRRIWKPMLKKQLEQGKLAQTGAGGGGVVAIPGSGAVPGLMTAQSAQTEFNRSIPPAGTISNQSNQGLQAIQHNYQQTLQQPQSSQQQTNFESYGTNNSYSQQPQPQHANHLGTQSSNQSFNPAYFQQKQFNQQQGGNGNTAQNSSIGSLPSLNGATGSTPPPNGTSNLNKTDSHAVLMELFARDQDLVRQATEGAKHRAAAAAAAGGGGILGVPNGQHQQPDSAGDLAQYGRNGVSSTQGGQHMTSQHPMVQKASSLGATGGSINKLGPVPSMNSWPHFSSVSSLNNLTMTGVKSITNMSGADLVSQGSMNKKGNLAQIKSIESMGRADSYAFLEVFFENNPSAPGSAQAQRGTKRDQEDDNVGLSLEDADPSPRVLNGPLHNSNQGSSVNPSDEPPATPPPDDDKDKEGLKRAYDDALAARGLISVSRSSENLNDLAIPAKMQRTLSQEYLKSMSNGGTNTFTSYSFLPNTANASHTNSVPLQSRSSSTFQTNQQFHSQNSQQQKQTTSPTKKISTSPSRSNSNLPSASVEVPSTTKCALCNCINVDTQLRPCGHMFHGRCLKPSLQQGSGPPRCPIDGITMQSAVLAVPTDENAISKVGGNINGSKPLTLNQVTKTET